MNTTQEPLRFSNNILKNAAKFILPTALLLGGLTAQGQVGTAVRELPFDFHPGDLVEVRLQVTPPPGTTNWSIRELYPDRWELISATNASSIDEFNGELVFGPFTNDSVRTLSYEILSNPGLTNSVLFDGTVTNNGVASPVAGTTFFPSRNEWLFVGPQSLLATPFASASGTAYGAGRWLYALNGWTTSLETGGRWTYPRLPRWFASRLEFVGGLFLLFGEGNGFKPALSISDDGLSWKVARSELGNPNVDPFAGSGALEAVAYGNGVYVAVGQHQYVGETEPRKGTIFTSTNGYFWKRTFQLTGQPTVNDVRTVCAVTFADGRFMAVASRGTLITSTNGLVWQEIQPIGNISSLTNVSLVGICHGDAGWIVPTSTGGLVLRSTDGESWSQLTGVGYPASSLSWWHSFFSDDKYWFSQASSAYTTSDGTSWARLADLPAPQPTGVVSRAPDGVNPRFLAQGPNSSSAVTSTNGTNWALALPGAVYNVGWPRYLSVASISNEWVVSGQGAVWTSGDNGPSDRPGKIWVPNFGGQVLSIRNASGQWRNGAVGIYADFMPTTNGLLAVRGAQNQLVANFLTGADYILSPSTALPSLSRAVAPQVYKGLAGQAWEWVNGSLTKTSDGFDLFAETYTYATLQIRWGHFTSTNGNNWLRRTNGLNHATNFPAIRGLAWGSGQYVAVSEGSSPGAAPSNPPITSTNRIYTSTNGEDYAAISPISISPLLGNEGLTGVAYASGRFVATGNSGRILTSTNGLDWETVRNSDGHRWNRVRYLDGIWAAVGNAGWVAFSSDGQNWTSKTAGAESDLTDIAHQNGQYMIVGSHAMVLLSLPVTPPVILAGSLVKSPGAGLQFDVSGHAGKVLDIQTSSNLVNWSSLLLRTNITGTVSINDPNPNQERRFYRAVQGP